ncbi:MAG TPA: hypothetical protein VGE07_13195 [Herpetosiphonaceae bacterium]
MTQTQAGAAAGQALPPRLRNAGAKLFGQQCWCWGRDIRRAEGNLLLDYGFRRHRPPAGELGASAYTFYLDRQRTAVLWGWGLWFEAGAGGQLFLGRNSFAPLLMAAPAAPTDVWALDQLPPARLPATAEEWLRARMLLAAAARWIGEYEAWVLRTVGAPYRCDCVAAWRKNAIAAEAMAAQWRQLAAGCL